MEKSVSEGCGAGKVMGVGRNERIDFIKGVCIVLMVLCHAGLSGLPRQLIYLFHMPVFLMVSGYFYNFERVKEKGLVAFFKSKFARLWWPCVVWASLFVVGSTLLPGVFSYQVDLVAGSEAFSGPTFLSVGKKLVLTVLSLHLPQMLTPLWFVGVVADFPFACVVGLPF